jgi:hypothetical protein
MKASESRSRVSSKMKMSEVKPIVKPQLAPISAILRQTASAQTNVPSGSSDSWLHATRSR